MEDRTMINKLWDKIGICASGLCLVHCLATPLLLIFFPTSLFADIHFELTHQIFAVIVTSSILIAVYPTCREHGHYDIIALAITGIILVLGAVFSHEIIGDNFSHGITVLGSIVLIIAHIKNMKVRHGKCDTEAESHCSH